MQRVITITIGGNGKGGQKALKDNEEAASSLSSKLGTLAKTGGAALAGLGTAAVAFAAKSANTFAKVGGEVLKLQRYTGATAEDASRLRFAGTQAGLGVDDMTKSLGLLSKNLQGTKLDKLGLDLKNADGSVKPLNQSLLTIADRFQSMPNGAEKTALAMQLFGKSGAAMIPFLNRGAAGIADLEKQSDKLGTTLSGKDLDAVKQSTANHRLFSAAMEGLQIQVGRYVLPILTRFTAFLASNMPGAIAGVQAIMQKLAPVFATVGSVIDKVAGQISLFWGSLTTGFTEDEGTPIEQVALNIRAAFEGVVTWVRTNWPEIKATVTSVMDGVSTAVSTVVGVIRAVWNTFGDDILAGVQRAWGPLSQIIGGTLQTIRGVIQTVTALIHGDWSGVWDGIKTIFSGVWNELVGTARLVLEQLRTAISIALDAIKAVMSGAWSAVSSAASSAWSGIKNTISGAITGVMNLFTSLPGRIKSALASIADFMAAPFKAGAAAIRSAWNSTIGGKGITIPDIPGLPGRGKRFEIPRLHTGGIVPGGTLSEPLFRLQGGEGVFTAGQMRALAPLDQLRSGLEQLRTQLTGAIGGQVDQLAGLLQPPAAGGVTVQVVVQGHVLAEQDLIDMIRSRLADLGIRGALAF